MFPMPRVVYSMASDGLIFKCLGWVAPKLKTPAAASISTGLFAAVLVLLFDLEQLIDMMSIGTLLAYSLVSACSLVLRYRPDDNQEESFESLTDTTRSSINANMIGSDEENLFKTLFNPVNRLCNQRSSDIVCYLTIAAGN